MIKRYAIALIAIPSVALAQTATVYDYNTVSTSSSTSTNTNNNVQSGTVTNNNNNVNTNTSVSTATNVNTNNNIQSGTLTNINQNTSTSTSVRGADTSMPEPSIDAAATLFGGQAATASASNYQLTGIVAAGRDSVMRGRLSEIRRAVDRGSELTRRLLAFSRQEPIATRPVDLNATVLELGGVLRRLIGEDVTVSFDLAPGPLTVLADEEAGQLQLGGKDYVCVAFIDTGSGMDPEVRERAFEPFFTTKGVGKGTGLGLSMVHGFVEQCGGALTIESTVGAGTTVSLWLPVSQEEETSIVGTDTPEGQIGRAHV